MGKRVLGTVTRGEVLINQTLMMGPNKIGGWMGITVKGIQENRVDVESAGKGMTVTILIKSVVKGQNFKFTRNSFKKGMTLIGLKPVPAGSKKSVNPTIALEQLCVREFEAEVVILHHATTIQENYQSVVHCGGIRQAARAVNIDKVDTSASPVPSSGMIASSGDGTQKKVLRTGDKGLVRFRFMYYPEFLKAGATIMFREGRTKGLGYVTKVYTQK